MVAMVLISTLGNLLAEASASNSATIMKIIIPQGAAVQGNLAYAPVSVKVPAGSLIIWENFDSVPHTVTSGTGPDDANAGRLFDSGILDSRQRFQMSTIGLSLGAYDYFCVVHPYMLGRFTISESASEQETFPLSINGNTYDIEYSVTGGKLIGLVADKDASTITAVIYSTDDGNLQIKLPTSVIREYSGANTVEFSVFVDGVPADVKDITTTEDSSTLSINFGKGAEIIEIVLPQIPGLWNTGQVMIDDNTYPIRYMITSGQVESMFVDLPARALMVTVNSKDAGQLTVELPRNIIDSRQDNNVDVRYQVFVGRLTENEGVMPATFQEIEKTDQRRVLVIDYPADSEYPSLIVIDGTHVIPEFASLVVPLMGASIVGTIVAARTLNKR